MQEYTIRAPDGREITIRAVSPEVALQGAQEWAAANPVEADGKPVERSGFGEVAAGLARGIPFAGGFRDEIAANVRSKLGGRPYEEVLREERSLDKKFEDEHPYADFALGAAGGVGGTIAALPGIAAAGTGGVVGTGLRTALGAGAKTLPGAVVRGAGAGAMQGAAAGAGSAQDGFVNRVGGATQGAAIGGVLGGSIPLGFEGVRRGAGAVVDKAKQVLGGATDSLGSLSRAARQYVGEIAEPARVQKWEDGLNKLGGEGMLAAVSDEWNMVAQGAATRPGSREVVSEPLRARHAQSTARLKTDIDANLGPATIPSKVAATIKESEKVVGNAYEKAFAGAKAVDTAAIAMDIDARIVNARGPVRDALIQARQWLNIHGAPDTLDPDPRTLHQTREALDGLIGDTTNKTVKRALVQVREQVDESLGRAVPGIKDVDAAWRELQRQRTALDRGQTIFDTGRGTVVRPQELADEMSKGALPEGRLAGPSAVPVRTREGARAEIDRVVGTAGNDAQAIKRTMRGTEEDGDWNPQKMATVFGDDPAQKTLDAVDREVRFQNTHNSVLGNSSTAARQHYSEFQNKAERPILGGQGSGDLGVVPFLINQARRLESAMIGALGRKRANQFATELGQYAVANQSVGRDEFVRAMKRLGANQKVIQRALDIATKGGLIAAREAPERAIELQEQGK